jgi:hypothetical protein
LYSLIAHAGEETPTRSSVQARDLFEANWLGNQIFAPRGHYIEAGLFDERFPAWQDMELFYRILLRFGPARLLDIPTYVQDTSRRDDRISVDSAKVRAAFQAFSEKHATHSARQQQRLFLQLFSRGYTMRPTAADWVKFLRLGIWPPGIYRLLRATWGPR